MTNIKDNNVYLILNDITKNIYIIKDKIQKNNKILYYYINQINIIDDKQIMTQFKNIVMETNKLLNEANNLLIKINNYKNKQKSLFIIIEKIMNEYIQLKDNFNIKIIENIIRRGKIFFPNVSEEEIRKRIYNNTIKDLIVDTNNIYNDAYSDIISCIKNINEIMNESVSLIHYNNHSVFISKDNHSVDKHSVDNHSVDKHNVDNHNVIYVQNENVVQEYKIKKRKCAFSIICMLLFTIVLVVITIFLLKNAKII